MVNKYDDEANRQKALNRAKSMEKLFAKKIKKEGSPDESHFASIMKAVDPVFVDIAFSEACSEAGLNAWQTHWLRTYLKNCDEAVYNNIPEAAASGW